MSGFGMGLGWLIPILIIIGFVYFLNDNKQKQDKEKSAKEILDIRLAKGDIDKKEYEERLNALNS